MTRGRSSWAKIREDLHRGILRLRKGALIVGAAGSAQAELIRRLIQKREVEKALGDRYASIGERAFEALTAGRVVEPEAAGFADLFREVDEKKGELTQVEAKISELRELIRSGGETGSEGPG